MMTTGYDCPDLLNLALMRPVFSPTDFVQIKGRGTRKHNFLEQLFDPELKSLVRDPDKTRYKLFDFFANCEYFEEKFNYDEVLQLSRPRAEGGGGPEPTPPPPGGIHISTLPDAVTTTTETQIGLEGMKIDRMFFEKFEDKAKTDPVLQEKIETENWDQAVEYVNAHLFDKPNEFFNLEKLRKAAGVDRRLTLREILEKVFGRIPGFKSKEELLDDEFQKFLLDCQPEEAEAIVPMKYYFKAYATDGRFRNIIDTKCFADLNVNPTFSMGDFKAVPQEWRNRIPEYVKDYVSLNQFM
jgi:type I restriction enzyme R subunit